MRTRNLRPLMPPCVLTWFAHASAASAVLPHAAAGPDSGVVRPMTISESVTPGVWAAAGIARSSSANSSPVKRILMDVSSLPSANPPTPAPRSSAQNYTRTAPAPAHLPRRPGLPAPVSPGQQRRRHDGSGAEPRRQAVDGGGEPLPTHRLGLEQPELAPAGRAEVRGREPDHAHP